MTQTKLTAREIILIQAADYYSDGENWGWVDEEGLWHL